MTSGKPLDVAELTRLLNRHGVDYVVIGGVAMQAHGHVRSTQDLDVIAAWSEENTARLSAALRSARSCVAWARTCWGSIHMTRASFTRRAT